MGFKSEECAVIEDSLPGIQAAIAGGFDVFGFATEKNKPTFEESGATVFSVIPIFICCLVLIE